MKNSNLKKGWALVALLAAFGAGFLFQSFVSAPEKSKTKSDTPLKMGAFSVSLSVKDLKASKEFYESMGFRWKGGSMEENYIVLKNQNAIIGLFQGMFEGNMMTFNPGWDESAKHIKKFDDVREIQRQLKAKGIKLDVEADEKTTGPAYFMLKDLDGNVILVDQHR